MSSHAYLKFPDDFQDQLITQKTGFVPFHHQATHKVQEFTGEQVQQAESTAAAAADQQLSINKLITETLSIKCKMSVISNTEHGMIITEQE